MFLDGCWLVVPLFGERYHILYILYMKWVSPWMMAWSCYACCLFFYCVYFVFLFPKNFPTTFLYVCHSWTADIRCGARASVYIGSCALNYDAIYLAWMSVVVVATRQCASTNSNEFTRDFEKKNVFCVLLFFSIHTTTTRLSMVLTKELQALLDEQPIHDRTIIRMVVWTNGNSYRYQSQIHSESEEIEDKKKYWHYQKSAPSSCRFN